MNSQNPQPKIGQLLNMNITQGFTFNSGKSLKASHNNHKLFFSEVKTKLDAKKYVP